MINWSFTERTLYSSRGPEVYYCSIYVKIKVRKNPTTIMLGTWGFASLRFYSYLWTTLFWYGGIVLLEFFLPCRFFFLTINKKMKGKKGCITLSWKEEVKKEKLSCWLCPNGQRSEMILHDLCAGRLINIQVPKLL